MIPAGRRPFLWLALLFSDAAFAHAPIEGIGSFYNGLLHPLLIPAHLILIIAIGLFVGQQVSKNTEIALGSFAMATMVGLILAWFTIGTQIVTFILVLSMTIGFLIAINPALRPPINRYVAIGLGALAGLALGMDSAQEALAGKEKLASLFGSGVAIYFLVLYPMTLADYFKEKAWQKIGIRVLGSWLAASSLLVLTLEFSKSA